MAPQMRHVMSWRRATEFNSALRSVSDAEELLRQAAKNRTDSKMTPQWSFFRWTWPNLKTSQGKWYCWVISHSDVDSVIEFRLLKLMKLQQKSLKLVNVGAVIFHALGWVDFFHGLILTVIVYNTVFGTASIIVYSRSFLCTLLDLMRNWLSL